MNPSPLLFPANFKLTIAAGSVFGLVGAEAGQGSPWIVVYAAIAGAVSAGLCALAGKWYDRRTNRQEQARASVLHLNDSRAGKDIRLYELNYYDRAALEARVERQTGVSVKILEDQIEEMKAQRVCDKKEHSEEIAGLKRELADERLHSDALEAQLRAK